MNRFLPDYCGFIFARSPRQITAQTASELIRHLDHRVTPVGVFVNVSADNIAETAARTGIRTVQLHGDEDASYIKHLRQCCPLPVWKAIRVKDRSSLKGISSFGADRYLLDAYSKTAYGGMGISFDWKLLEGISGSQIILAGGLNLTNIDKAIDTVHPFMIDLNSGVETAGKKDEEKIKAILEHIRARYQ